VNTCGYGEVFVNQYFVEHPEHIIGIPAMDGHTYRSDGYTVHAAGMDIPAELKRIYAALPGLEFAPVEKTVTTSSFADEVVISTQSAEFPITQELMAIHDAAKKLIRAETRGDTSVAALRDLLNRLYDAFVARHGCINDKSNLRLLKSGAELPFLKALEKYDPVMGVAAKADIFFKSTVRTAAQVLAVSASDALLLSLDRTGKVDLHFIAITAGVREHEAAEQLRGAVYLDPITHAWQTSEQYLSGNVREKLRQAKAAAQYDARFQENVAALESALPLTVQVKDIRAPLGAGWIPEETISDFLVHLLKDGKYKVTYIEPLATWEVEAENIYYVSRQLLSQKWGTSRANAVTLVAHGLNSHEVVIYDGMGEERVVNQTETVAAQAKLLEIKEEFERWLWSDPQRANHLGEVYNEKFNSVRVAKYDGSHLSTPGLSTAIKLRSNQRDAAWRIIQNQATLIGHEVGMGKTLTAIVAAMESKRLGFTRKAMIVVPNHTLVNWQAVMQIAYPGANMLIPNADDLSKEKRGEFLSRVATSDWDLILVPFSSFKLLPISSQAKRDFYAEQIAELEEYLYEEKAKNKGKTRAQKEIEKALKRFDKKMKDLDLFDKDSEQVITFEELGVDFLCVDEFHNFKNLYFNSRMTRIAGLTNTDSQRAFDMYIKSRWLLSNGGKFVGLTGTPVTNTIAELFTMQRYFQMCTLKQLGLSQFDAWARQFALAEPGLEMTPDGAGFRMNTRFRKFVNMTELMQAWLQAADMRRIDSNEIERPQLYRGKPIKVASFAGKELQDFVMSLAARAEKVRTGKVRPDVDNMLMITSDGRKAAADLSLVVPALPNADMPKIDGLVSLVKLIRETTNPVKGAQLIFCDLAVPKSKAERKDESEDDSSVDTAEETRLTDNLYSEIKVRLARLGIPIEEIAFIHDARNEKDRANLFKAVNNGSVRILIGSNEKMGTGLNVQERLIAVHHVTPPWRPGDLEQQLGRMLRQGNLFTLVFQFVHVLSGSFDGYTWQLLENKAAFIAQIMSGSMTDREVDDIGETVLTFSEIKALASGNPKIMRKITLEAEWQRMKALCDAWGSTVFTLKADMRFKQSGLEGEKEKAQAFREAVSLRDMSTTEEFSVTLNEVFGAGEEVFTKREEAGRRLKVLAAQAAQKVARGSLSVPLGKYRGHVIFCSLDNRSSEEPQPYLYFEVYGKWLPFGGTDEVGITRSMDLSLKNMDKVLAECEATIAAWERDIASYEVELQKPWEHEAKFKSLEDELFALDAELMLGHTQPKSKKLRPADSASEKEEIIAQVQAMMSDPAAKSISDRLNGIASREVIESMLALQSLMVSPEQLARFEAPAEIPVTNEALAEIGAEIKRLQALYEFGKAVQLSLFGDMSAPPARKRRR
jgi:N12 class adenine-specific DNA methylase